MGKIMDISRLFAKLTSIDDCWVWDAATRNGYGVFGYRGKMWGAHRVTYTEFVGEIPEGYDVDHLCRNPLCVNPDHLEAVTRLENILRRQFTPRTSCHNGHTYTTDNTYIRPSGLQECRICRRAQNLKRRALTV